MKTLTLENNSTIAINQEIPFSEFLEGFKSKIKKAFHVDDDIDKLSVQRRLPAQTLNDIMSYNPLSVCIPKQYGGHGYSTHECIALMSEASYESLALSLTLSINYALFLQPVIKYAQEDAKLPLFKRFLEHQNMGGLMITEPGHGSDALNMQTFYTEQNGYFHLKGTKHWAGLTGMANYWLLTARKSGDNGLLRDIDFFICDVNTAGQEIVVEEYFENLGLYQIPYGRNLIDVSIPQNQRLIPQTSGVQMMLDTLHRSRLQFPGMGMGFIKRMLEEAIKHTRERKVGGRNLYSYDQVQHRLARLQANYTICSALCVVGSEMAGIENDLTQKGLEANIIKSITTDLMQDSSQSLLQLVGASGYKLNHIAGRSTVDSRPFQIFEGSNDILYVQICESFLKLMNTAKETNLYQFLKSFSLTSRASEIIKDLVDFELNKNLSQRKLVDLGIVISRIAAMNSTAIMIDRGFRPDLIQGAINMLKQEISGQINTFSFAQNTTLFDDYSENSHWLDFVK